MSLQCHKWACYVMYLRGTVFNFTSTTFHSSKSWEWQLHYPPHLELLDGAIHLHPLYKFRSLTCNPMSSMITPVCMGIIVR